MPGAFTPIDKADVPLAVAAGAEVTWRGGGKRRVPMVAGFVAAALLLVKRLARRQGTDPVNILKRLNELGQLRVAGQLASRNDVEAAEFTPILAEVLGVRITLGPVRVYPNGDCEITNGRGSWQPATDELLQALDAERMMNDGQETIAEMAARLVLDWREARRQP